jgi:hypothetical protein
MVGIAVESVLGVMERIVDEDDANILIVGAILVVSSVGLTVGLTDGGYVDRGVLDGIKVGVLVGCLVLG